ncbi:MAG: response regulator [Candidatus Staskawiczbacteria bacterium]|nr:response regulator [Candidatus Staskawiczbacteria bacterium]
MEDKKTILVVEDEKPLMDAVKKKLELSGFYVVTARSVEQALSYLKDLEKVDLVWLDHYLIGKENGLDLVAKMKEDGSEWKKVHIFVVSNTASPDKVNSYLHLGIDKYFTKADYRLDDIIKYMNDVF